MLSPVSAGFPSPAEDHVDGVLDLNALLIDNKPATYLIRVSGNSMQGAGILDGDIVIVDASKKPRSNDIVIASISNDFLVKRWIVEKGSTYLKAEHPDYPATKIGQDDEVTVFGVVTGVVRKMK